MENYYIRGPIGVHEKFIMVAEQAETDPRIEKFPAFVTWSYELNTYVLDPSANVQPAVFEAERITETLALAILDTQQPNVFLNMQSDGFATRSPNRQIFRLATNVRAWPDTPMLAGTSCLFRVGCESMKFHRYLPNTVNYNNDQCQPPECIVNDRRFPSGEHYRVRLVPIKLYLDGNCNQVIDNAQQVTKLEQQWILKNFLTNTGCPCNARYFTVKSQCEQWQWYEYCLPFQQCGDNNCVGAANDSSLICGFNTSRRRFETERKTFIYSEPNPWIAVVVIVLAVLLILFMVRYVVARDTEIF